MTIDTTGGTFIQFAGWCRWRGQGIYIYDVFPEFVKGFSLSLFLKLDPLEHFLETFFLTFFVTCLGFNREEGEWNMSSGPISFLFSL